MTRRRRSQHCCYGLLDIVGDVIYVGSTCNLYRRLLEHRSRGCIPFFRFLVWHCSRDRQRNLEAELIRQHQPRYNKLLNATWRRTDDFVSTASIRQGGSSNKATSVAANRSLSRTDRQMPDGVNA
jgi:hypothetical protein